MSSNYDKFLQIIKRWPVNETRRSRDLGYYLRELLKNSKWHGEIFPGSAEENSKKMDALMRLLDDKYLKKYPHSKPVGATGLSLQNLEKALSDDVIRRKVN